MIEPQVRTAIGMWYTKGLDILDAIENVDWNITPIEFSYLLTYYFRFENILFEVHESTNRFMKYVDCATFYDSGAVQVIITPESIRYLKKLCFSKEDYMLRWMDFRRNHFAYELIEVLSHELLHRLQHNLGEKYSPKTSVDVDDIEYFSDVSEIQAHAQDIAFFIVYGRNDWRRRYYIDLYRQFGNDSPQFKRFMKWVHKFVEKMTQDQIGLLP